jgi:hypothetical protein
MEYAQKLKLPAVAGSDIHNAAQIYRGEIFGVYLEKKMRTIDDYAEAIRHNTIAGLRMSPGRCEMRGRETIKLPVEIRDSLDRVIRKNWKEELGYE